MRRAHYDACERSSSLTCTWARPSGPTCCAAPSCASRCWRPCADVDRLVILGDGLELREARTATRSTVAGPLFGDVGRALGPDGELLMLAGNHDHGLVAGWIDGRLQTEPAGFLGLEQRIEPARRRAARRRARRARRACARCSSPTRACGCATTSTRIHGHYSDLHTTVPTFERLAAGAMARWIVPAARDAARAGRLRGGARAAVRVDARAHPALRPRGRERRGGRVGACLGGDGRARPAAAPGAHDAARRRLHDRGGGLNAVGLGPLAAGPDRPPALRRGYLHGIREVVRRLGIGAPHVIWGHSHRSGPWPGDDLAEWTDATPAARIVNTGSWVYQPHFLTPQPNGSPYWPGTAVLIEDDGPPRLLRLLGERGHAQLRPRRREAGREARHAGADLEHELARRCGAGARRAGSSRARGSSARGR